MAMAVAVSGSLGAVLRVFALRKREAVEHTPGPRASAERRKERVMPENTDDAKGRVKEAAGDLTGDKDLQREGKIDQATGKVKDAVGDAADKVKDAVNRDKD